MSSKMQVKRLRNQRPPKTGRGCQGAPRKNQDEDDANPCGRWAVCLQKHKKMGSQCGASLTAQIVACVRNIFEGGAPLKYGFLNFRCKTQRRTTGRKRKKNGQE
ncbi:hypothetical protein DdX_04469 [Ditylenchus destructor]|uniref:Uncharacterized protein n=1 Tax=Ditylenchus destructor TaxID=166010 RepID=A0AAD4NBK9_9BILA|nr:hypothetical protein DdX_04469 [Ditylenchus destructor]